MALNPYGEMTETEYKLKNGIPFSGEETGSSKDWTGSDDMMGYFGMGASLIAGIAGISKRNDLKTYMDNSGKSLDEVYNNLSDINGAYQTGVRKQMFQDQANATPQMDQLTGMAYLSGAGEYATTLANKQRTAGTSKAREAALSTWLKYRTEIDAKLPMLKAQIEEQKMKQRMYEDSQESDIFGSIGGLLGAGIGFALGGGPAGAGLGAQMGGMLGRAFH